MLAVWQRVGRALLLLQYRPVEHVVILKVHRAEQQTEELTQVDVVGHLLKLQCTAVVQVHCKLRRMTLHQDKTTRKSPAVNAVSSCAQPTYTKCQQHTMQFIRCTSTNCHQTCKAQDIHSSHHLHYRPSRLYDSVILLEVEISSLISILNKWPK